MARGSGEAARDYGAALARTSITIGRREMRKIDMTKVPELKTRVGIYGSAKQQEVGGVYCGGIVVLVVTG
jgi:hypothetical protein